ncbi:very long chain fatty acid elongase 1-like [Dermatophagoides pteronyssinus]|uniref:very long chain fatty acid elongase 1-like n=1 Tax=Dermatophagoides pteronyssinus TaxID=6956 RepID=UPI003F678D00
MWWKLQQFDFLFEYVGMTPDFRTKHLLWVNVSPILVIWAIINCVIFAKIIGPEVMRGLPAFDVRWLMFIYNITMSACNCFAVYKVVSLSNYFRILLNFDYPDRMDCSTRSFYLIHLGYLYWLSKILDLWDTSFFVIRKKFSQITLLHVYHHTVVPLFGYILLRVNPILPCVFLFTFINSTVHVIMYSYYGLAALGPWIQPYLWWKKYITILQLYQFVLYGFYGFLIWIFGQNYPVFWLYLGLTQPPLFFWLFFDFYMKAYNRTAMDIWRALLMYRHHRHHRRGLQDDRQTSEIKKKPMDNMTIVNDNKDDDNDLYLTTKNGLKID